ncbi:MAG: hypothetical protein J7M26_02680, partial [Armatimonadetes bacterium]|nr:hypothetical protein [Armatimonadota bacterium]
MAQSNALTLTWPWDGDVLNRHDGTEERGTLTTTVKGKAWPGAIVEVMGEKVEAGADGVFEVPVRLTAGEQELRVTAQGAGASAQAGVRVVFRPNSRRCYRFSVDDNVLFLRDLAQEPASYSSLFDHWFLKFWR